MFVQSFDGPWMRHPFWLPRFQLTDPDDLQRLLDSDIATLVIDESRGEPLERAVAPPAPSAAETPVRSPEPCRSEPKASRATVVRHAAGTDRPCAAAEERERALKVMQRSKRAMKGVFDGARLGRAIRSEDVAPVVGEISASVHRNPASLIGLTRLKTKDEYTYLHSVAVCALMVNFARHLGLDPAQTYDLGMAGLLHDVGKMAVPDQVLNKPGSLTDEEFAIIRTHPEQGWRLLNEGDGVPALALDVCRHHHERMDGTGYPHRLPGAEISLAARMGAICDVYDALTSARPYKDAWHPAEAVTRMHGWQGHFDPELLFRFMQSIGVFPTGMLVRLRSNRLGVVLDNGRRASRPRVRAFFSTREREVLPFAEVVIDDSLAVDQIVSEERPEAWGFADWPMLSEQIMAGSDALLRRHGRAEAA